MIARIARDDFVYTRWDYRSGEHVTILGPTGWGKTTLAGQLLNQVATPDRPAIVLVMKGQDDTVDEWRKATGWRAVRTWPPPPTVWKPRKPAGWFLWPAHHGEVEDIERRQYWEFREALKLPTGRKRKPKIVFGDEVADLREIGLERILSHTLRQGRSAGVGFWSATQRPFNAPLACYGQAMHLFIGNDPDKRSRQRYAEIGGVDPKRVEQESAALSQFEWLYIRRARGSDSPRMCIVEA